jgi:hypothetical protein
VFSIRKKFLSDPINPELLFRIRETNSLRILLGHFCGHWKKYVVKCGVGNKSLKVVTNEKGEASGTILTITYMLVGEVVLDVFLSF